MTTSLEHTRVDTDCQDKHRAITTSAMKKYIKEMDETGLMPSHIWSGLRRFIAAPPLNGQPSYNQVIHCVKYTRLKNRECNSVDSIKALVVEFSLQFGIDEDKAFMFGANV